MFGQQYGEFTEWYARYSERISREQISTQDRISLMNRSNPSIVPRNYLLQQAIERAELKVREY